MPPPKLLTPRDLAERLDARYDDVLTWARRGYIPSIKVAGRIYFNLAQVCETLRDRREAPAEEAASCV